MPKVFFCYFKILFENKNKSTTEQKDFWRDHDNETPEFEQSEAVFTGPSRIIVGKQSTFTTVAEIEPGIYTAVKGNFTDTTGMEAEYLLSIIEPDRVSAVRLDFGMSKLIYEIAFRYGGCKEFCEKDLYSDKDVFQVLNASTPTFAQVLHIDKLVSLSDFGKNLREEYGESGYILKVLEVARDLFQLVGTMNNFGIFHRNLVPGEIFIASVKVKKSSSPAVPTSTSTSSNSTAPPPAPENFDDDEFVERIALGDFEFSCSLIVDSIMNRLVNLVSEFSNPNITRTCLLEHLTQQPGGQMSMLLYDGPEGSWSDPLTLRPDARMSVIHNDQQAADILDRVRSDWGHYEAYSCAQVVEWLLQGIEGYKPKSEVAEGDNPEEVEKSKIYEQLSIAVTSVRSILTMMRNPNLRYRKTLLAASQQVGSILADLKRNTKIAKAVSKRSLRPPRSGDRSLKMPSHQHRLRARAFFGGHFPKK